MLLHAVIVSVADCVLPQVPAIVAVVAAPVCEVVTVNEADVAPAGIVTSAGTEANEVDELSDTIAPDAGAGPPSVTVPLTAAPPCTELDARATDARPLLEGMTVTVTDCGAVAAVAV